MKILPFPDFLTPFSPRILEELSTVRRLLEGEYGGRCFVVGGAVRDRLLGRRVEDLDLEIYGLSPERFGEAMERLGASGVGKSFFVYKYGALDLALPRKERKVGRGHRGFAVEPAGDPREASRRRDFTVNALLYDLREEKVLDFWGGLEDLEARSLRCVDPVTFVEDSLRVLRGMRFAGQLGFRVEEGTCRLCREIPLDDLPGARIFGEFEKLFSSEYPHYGLRELLRLGIAGKLWGEEIGMEGFFRAARRMARWIPATPLSVRSYCFLAIYAQQSTVPTERILEAIDAPNRYRRKLERLPKLPERMGPAFVAELARKEGLADSPLACFPHIRSLAKRLGVWNHPFMIGVTPEELMERGFHGKALGEELERIRREKIRILETKWNGKK
ncbi:hypothetical protein [Nitratifractor sp.]